MKLASVAAAAALLTALAAPAHSLELIQNGSFEATTQGAGTWAIYNSLPYWTGYPNVELRNNVAGTAFEGVNFVELDANFNSAIGQTFTVGPGTTSAVLSFAYAARPGTSASTNGLSYYVEGEGAEFFGSVQPSTTGGNAYQWATFSQSLGPLAAGSYTLYLSAINRSDSFGTSLDSVSISAVPEPGSLALMVAGLGAVGFMAKRRRQRG